MNARFNVWCEYELKGRYHKKMFTSGNHFHISQTGEVVSYLFGMMGSGTEDFYKKLILVPLFFISMLGQDDVSLFEGDVVEGFGSRFLIKFGIVPVEKIAPDNTTNVVDCSSFFFETENGQPVYPIRNNSFGEHDLRQLNKIGNIFEHPELWNGKWEIVKTNNGWKLI